MEVITIMLGGAIAYGTGDPLRLIEDIQLIRPSLLPSVPRVMNRVVSAAMATSTAGGLKGALFNRALQTKLANFHKNGVNTHMLWDRLVFSKVTHILPLETFAQTVDRFKRFLAADYDCWVWDLLQ